MSNIAADFLLHLGQICLIYSLLVFKKKICIQKQQPYQTEVVKLRSTIWKPQKVFPTDLVCKLGSGFPVTKLLHIIGHLSFYASTPQKSVQIFLLAKDMSDIFGLWNYLREPFVDWLMGTVGQLAVKFYDSVYGVN